MSVFDRILSHAERHRDIALAAARKRLARGEDPVQVMEALTVSLANRLLHPPMRALNHAATSRNEELARSLASLYLP